MVWQRNYLNFHIMKDPLQPFDTTTSGGFPGAKSGPPHGRAYRPDPQAHIRDN
jgi:hypothetical protein